MNGRILRRTAGICVMAGLLCAGGTTAYLMDYDLKYNSVAVGRNTTGIREEFPAPTPVSGDENQPEYQKTVWAANQAPSESVFNVDCYVRMSLSYSNYDIGRSVTLLGLDQTNWIYSQKDGYYYYRKKLKEGERTTPLFTGFRIRTEQIDPVYRDLISSFEINVYQESVQAGEFQDYNSAWNYYLNPVGTV